MDVVAADMKLFSTKILVLDVTDFDVGKGFDVGRMASTTTQYQLLSYLGTVMRTHDDFRNLLAYLRD